MFQPRFAPLVKSGAKRQTVRPKPARMPYLGQAISLREWSGKPYRSKQRILGAGRVTQVSNVIIDTAPIMGCFIWVDQIQLGWKEANDFAIADGFESLKDMNAWFTFNHTLPFVGILIRWELI